MKIAHWSLVTLLVVGVGCHESVRAGFWVADPIPSATQRSFPEGTRTSYTGRPLRPPTGPGEVDRRLGVCFSGGGPRSASATLGQLRGLAEIGLLDQVDYISCVSGGAWAASVYVFAKGDVHRLLGTYADPGTITMDRWRNGPDRSLARVIAELCTPTWAEILLRSLLSIACIRDSQLFAKVLDNSFYHPLDIKGRSHFVTQDEATRQATIDANPALKACDFEMPAKNRPFLIMNGVIRRYDIWPWEWDHAINKRMPLEMTPLYVGLPHTFHDVGKDGVSVGGTYVEPLAYGASSVTRTGNRITATLTGDPVEFSARRFGLADMIAVSGAAPSELGVFAHVAFPYHHNWSADNPPEKSTDKHDTAEHYNHVERYYHGDGGHADNLGVMPLLARRVPRIICFVNSESRGVPDYVRELFGQHTNEYGDWHSRGVFPNERLQDLEAAMAKCRTGGLPVMTATYRVRDPSTQTGEDDFGLHLSPGEAYDVKVAWFFLDATRWKSELNNEVKSKLDDECEFSNFPHYKTFLNRPLSLVEVTQQEVNALADLTSWTVVQSKDKLTEMVAPAGAATGSGVVAPMTARVMVGSPPRTAAGPRAADVTSRRS